MKKDDRNTAIIVTMVLVVCTISLIAIAGSLWSIVAPGLNSTLSFIGFNVKLANANYNFQLPSVAELSPTPTLPQGSDIDESVNVVRRYEHNFQLPAPTEIDSVEQQLDGILYDAQLSATSLLPETPQIRGEIVIPSLNLAAAVVASQDPLAGLEIGFWEYPSLEGGQVLLCLRDYFAVGDIRSCHNLAQVEVGDQAWWKFTGDVREGYRVVGVSTFRAEDTSIYNTATGYLKLVTSTPLDDRLVVLLERVWE